MTRYYAPGSCYATNGACRHNLCSGRFTATTAPCGGCCNRIGGCLAHIEAQEDEA